MSDKPTCDYALCAAPLEAGPGGAVKPEGDGLDGTYCCVQCMDAATAATRAAAEDARFSQRPQAADYSEWEDGNV